MHDIKWIRENPSAFDEALKRRGLSGQAQNLISIDEHRRAIIRVKEGCLSRRKEASAKIADAMKRKDQALAESLMAEVADLKASISRLEAEEAEAEGRLNRLLLEIPNLPLKEVPNGADEHGNVEHHKFGAPPVLTFTPRQHFELGEGLKQMDFEAASRMSGARFVVLKSKLARLERALAQFMLDLHTTEHGYTEVSPPLLVRDDAMFGTAQLPKFFDDQFAALSGEGLKSVARGAEPVSLDPNEEKPLEYLGLAANRRWLIPTAEVPLTNLVREQILNETELPLRLTAGTYCFRAEAGAAGRDTRGMIRQHQFYKVELVSITTPEESKNEHERMLSCAEEVLRRLGLHYRVITLCTGDMGFASQKTYDIEVWLPGQGMFREISSCSVCGDFQARRMSARYRTAEGRAVRPVHTLNGSGVAVGRAMIAVMENYQQADGAIAVPDVLQPYMGGLKVIEATA
ncbi:serine--tRNA ligase [Rhodoplanes sp. TEM]|uniref:Serine--tRNA ligase n=1 Tax=Rhodoplanes tepidamans TaxID=200616 RepID=A0ABT5JJJ2_RHOTP|nr:MULTISPECIES: serine--tRNA ligase [Rhodoplanes]MDC7789883.1 serine--tRNA ligase [Rhodoplanes tepidamans]MDC7988119.1 serine--tRNA ligase [Rhodoplanes sp. TEM]MDQ0355313.1 seryl-tRNA synthetase [Rhodoplanes tepidamans]